MTYELFVIADTERSDVGLEIWPRAAGSWKLSTSEGESSVTAMSSEGVTEARYRVVAGTAWARLGFEDSMFGDDCWVRADGEALLGAGSSGAEGTVAPAAIMLLDRYRPAGRPQAGTTTLAATLSALGFQKVVNASAQELIGVRVPVDLDLVEGRFYRAYIYPSDVIDAVESLDSDTREMNAVKILLAQANLPLFWSVQYDGFGDELEIKRPPSSKILTANEKCPT